MGDPGEIGGSQAPCLITARWSGSTDEIESMPEKEETQVENDCKERREENLEQNDEKGGDAEEEEKTDEEERKQEDGKKEEEENDAASVLTEQELRCPEVPAQLD